MIKKLDFSKLPLEVDITKLASIYYQPPANISIKYPAIIYKRKDIEKVHANDKAYIMRCSYDITVIDKRKDSVIVEELLKLSHCSFQNEFTTDGLNHTNLTLYI